ncbi:MAG: exo-alpha-sialidase [Gammaproteobacteria bacterium]|nr:exo-alpha-sialidase [Gammaproteobacteria bacterium]
MKINRRALIAGAAASVMPRGQVSAWPRRGVLVDIGHGWNTLPLGAGGLINGFTFASDGTMVCWTDVGNVYRWSGTIDTLTNASDRWVPLMTYASFGATPAGNRMTQTPGSIAMAIADSQTTRFMASMPDFSSSGLAKWWLYYSNDRGDHWTASDLDFLNQDSSGATGTGVFGRKFGNRRIAIDPANPDYAYFGMTRSSGKGAGCYKTINGGVNWAKMKLSPGGSDVADTTIEPGCCGIMFDPRQGTIVNGAGHTVTKRIIIPVGGVGIYVSTDGGDNWTETWVSAGNSASFAPYKAEMDYDGTYYMFYTTDSTNCRMARYMSPVNGTPAWLILSTGSKWPYASTIELSNNVLIVDPRNGHQGTVAICMGGGIGAGFNCTSGNIHTTTTLSAIDWKGATSARVFVAANSYDIGWQQDLEPATPGSTTFLSSTEALIAPDGRCLWTGFRGFWWYDAMPNFGDTNFPGGVGGSTVNNPTNAPIRNAGRGIEETVTEYICCPPGATYPVMATQDVGIMRGTFTQYPTSQFIAHNRIAAFSVEYAANDSSFIAAKINTNGNISNILANTFGCSAYNENYGHPDDWVQYTTQPDGRYGAQLNVDIAAHTDNWATMTVNSIVSPGFIQPGQEIWLNSSVQKGTIFKQIDGTPGGVGHYVLTMHAGNTTPIGPNLQTVIDRSAITATDVFALRSTVGGFIAPVDADHHIFVPDANGSIGDYTNTQVASFYGCFIPLYTTNAKDPSAVTWNYCAGLPPTSYRNRGNVNGDRSRPFAMGYGSDFGTVWAAATRAQVQVLDATASPNTPLVRLTVASTAGIPDGSVRCVQNVTGVTSITFNTPEFVMDVIDDTHVDLLGSTFVGAHSSVQTFSFLVADIANVPIVGDTLYAAAGINSSGASGVVASITGSGGVGSSRTVTFSHLPILFTPGDSIRIGSISGPFIGYWTGTPSFTGGIIDGVDIYKSTDKGANFSFVGSVPVGATRGGPLFFSVPGYPGHLWFTARFTSGANKFNSIWRSTDSGATWSRPTVAQPGYNSQSALPGDGVPKFFCLGAPQTPGGYPTLYCAFWVQPTRPKIYYATNGDGALNSLNWTILGTNGTQDELPDSCEVFGIGGILGDWNVFRRIYGIATPQGNVYYNQ